MQFQLSIPEDLQYGRLPATDARPGQLQRSMQQALVKALASQLDDDEATVDGSDTLPPRFEKALARFSGEIKTLHINAGPGEYDKLWERLLAAQREMEAARAKATGQSARSPAPDGSDPIEASATRALFCLTLYGLCGALAAQHLERSESEDVEDRQAGQAPSDDPGDFDMLELVSLDESSEPLAPNALGNALAVKRAFVQKAISELLARSLPVLSDDDNPDEERAKRNMLSGVLLDCCRSAMADWMTQVPVKKKASKPKKKVEESDTKQKKKKPSDVEYYLVLTDENIAERFERVAIELPFSLPPQPLRKPVAYTLRPAGGTTSSGGAFQINLISYRRQNSFLRRLHGTLAEHASPGFQRYVQAVNAQMAVGWRLNMSVLDALQGLMDRARTGNRMDTTALWVREALYLPSRRMPRRSYQRPAEFLDHPMMQAVMEELAVRHEDGSQPVFYLPWFADHRGRIYARTPWLTPQGGDVQRSLLEFADGRPLDDAGWVALRHHGANLVKKSRLLQDLEITGRTSVTLEEREQWVEQNEAQICASAADPCEQVFWREVAGGSAVQFLAFCLAYRQAKIDPQAPVHLPVQIDGTCNGLQHIAALTGDARLARSVNVLADESGLPRDIYSELAATARDRIRAGDSAITPGDSVQKSLKRNIEKWLASTKLLEGFLDRAAAKKVIMTIPYGAGDNAQITHVLEHLLPQLQGLPKLKDVSSNPLDDTFVELLALPPELRAQAERPSLQYELWPELRRVFHRWLRDQRNKTFADVMDDSSRAARLAQLRAWYDMPDPRDLELFRIALPLAMVIVDHLQKALETNYDGPKSFSNFLRTAADQLKGISLLWLTPLDFPVCQDKFAMKGPKLSGSVWRQKKNADRQYFEEEQFDFDAKHLLENLDKDAVTGQRKALMPNVIHSFDATHLASIILAASDRGVQQFGSIHDCLLLHPNDVNITNPIVRNNFVKLHQAKESGVHAAFADWRNWMELLRRLRASQRPSEILKALKMPMGNEEEDWEDADRELLADLRAMPKNKMRDSMIDETLAFLAKSGAPLPQAQKGAILLPSRPALFARDGGSDQASRYLFS